MGHEIRAMLGNNNTIQKLADNWISAYTKKLPQNYAMILLTDILFDDVTELSDEENMLDCSVLTYFTTAIFHLLQEASFHSALVYIEMDYISGYENPAGVLLENGEITLGPVKGTDAINYILYKIGVRKWNGKDELDSLGLKHYGRI